MLTAQEIFDKAVSGIRAQGGFGYSCGGCAYLAPNGNRCAIGMLVSEEVAAKWVKACFGSFDLSGEAMHQDLMNKGIDPKTHFKLLQDLQDAHDNAATNTGTMEEFEALVAKIAL